MFYSEYDSIKSIVSTLSSLFDFFEFFLSEVKRVKYLSFRMNKIDISNFYFYCILALGMAIGGVGGGVGWGFWDGMGLGCPQDPPSQGNMCANSHLALPCHENPTHLVWLTASLLPPLFFKYLKYGSSLDAEFNKLITENKKLGFSGLMVL